MYYYLTNVQYVPSAIWFHSELNSYSYIKHVFCMKTNRFILNKGFSKNSPLFFVKDGIACLSYELGIILSSL